MGWAVTPQLMVSDVSQERLTVDCCSGKKLSGVYARVSEALDWIRESVTDGQCYT